MTVNYYFDKADPLRPYAYSLEANPGTLPPINAARLKPELKDGFWPCWNGEAWIWVEDHRGLSGWLNGEKIYIKTLGPLPEGFNDTPPGPTPEEIASARLAEITETLAALDAKYLSARTLADLALGDEFALTQYERHETEAEPLRKERAELAHLMKGEAHAEN